MRTTITIEDDAFQTASAYAHARALKLGQAVSELIRLANRRQMAMKQVDGAWVFDLPDDTPPVTARQVRELLEETA